MLPSASIINIDPNTLQPQTFSSGEENIIPNFEIQSIFDPQKDKIEFFIYDGNKELLVSNYNFSNWSLEQDSPTSGGLQNINLNPQSDVINSGYNKGEVNVVYNFISNQIGSSDNNPFYISDISSDRTEIRLRSNFMAPGELSLNFNQFSSSILDNNNYFDEFYLNFGENNYAIGINALLEENSFLVKLYSPLSLDYSLDSTCFVVTKAAESVAYNIKFSNFVSIPNNISNIKGPNYNIDIKNKGGISTNYQNKIDLISAPSSSSQYQLDNLLSNKGVTINSDYTDFSTFIHFSSAKKRLENFYYKVSAIEDYQNDINDLYDITGSASSSVAISASKNIIENTINDIISHFDGYEYYLYYESSSWAWPKSSSLYPYVLFSTSSIEVSNWYDGIISSASAYDDANQDNLIYTIPEFIREDSDNINYESFVYMMGQFFDILWLYTKGITDKLNADNRLLEGISKDLVADTIRSLGFNTYTNNFALQDLYTSLIGATPSGSYLPPTGSEYITDYIAVNSGSNNYPYSIDNINKEIYKRLYHNISYILKRKGTAQSIRELANIYGIPSTILRINEFGGRDRINSNADYWQNIFNYALTFHGETGTSVRTAFSVNPNNTNTDPTTVLLRVKFPTFFSNQDYLTHRSQSIFHLGRTPGSDIDPKPFALVVEYTGSLTSGSYSGSVEDPYKHYGNIKLLMSGSVTGNLYSASVYVPVFNGDWWSIMIRRDPDYIKLFAKNKQYNGYDGNIIGYQASASLLTSETGSWVSPAVTSLIRMSNGNYTWGGGLYKSMSGSIQELRYYNVPLSESAFDSFVLNPLSIEGNNIDTSQTAYNTLRFRAPLGADLIGGDEQELYNLTENFVEYSFVLKDMHPSVTGSSPTASYSSVANIGNTNDGRYILPPTGTLHQSWSFQPNTEYIFIKEPIAGISNRVSNKLQIDNTSSPGDALSNLISIQQNYINSSSYTSDINYLEVAFSPSNEINDDISDQFGGFNIGNYISPDEIYGTSSVTYYPSLRELSEEYFKKYIHPYDVWDYIRLIKFYDNSFFKFVKELVPARTSLASGIVIKQHLLERNRYSLPDPNANTYITNIASASTNISYELGNIYLTASINSEPYLLDGQKAYSSSGDWDTNPIEQSIGGNGGVMPSASSEYGNYGESSFNGLNTELTQSWIGVNDTIAGILYFTQSTQDEFYNGEFSGSCLKAADQSLICEECEALLVAPSTLITYNLKLYNSATHSIAYFLDPNSSPSASEAYLFYDTGSVSDIGYYIPDDL